jgi:hypothetical protein
MNAALVTSLAIELTAMAFQIERQNVPSSNVAFVGNITKRIVLLPLCKPLPWSGIGTTNEQIDNRHRPASFISARDQMANGGFRDRRQSDCMAALAAKNAASVS